MTRNDILTRISTLYPRNNEYYYMMNGKIFICDDKGYPQGLFGRIDTMKWQNEGIVEVELYQVPQVVCLQ